MKQRNKHESADQKHKSADFIFEGLDKELLVLTAGDQNHHCYYKEPNVGGDNREYRRDW